jgi:Ca-activated chloride channel family protein
MGFESPLALLSLAVLPVAVAAYLLLRRRRARYALHFTNVDVLRSVAPRLGPRRERVVGLLVVVVLALLGLAVARPQLTRTVSVENATVVLVLDTSRSMLSRDVAPTRLAAAKQAALRFLDRAPERLRVGLVTFAGDVTVAAFPTHEGEQVRESVAAITRWQAGGGTAIGDALARAVEVGGDAFGEAGLRAPSQVGPDESPVTILFLSDGRQNRGLIPAEEGAAVAKRAGIPVYTVALGTDNPGSLGGRQGGLGFGASGFYRIPDRGTLRAIARTTGGEYFAARSSEAHASAYGDLGSRPGRERRRAEVTHLVVAAAGVALAVAAGLARIWAPGLP